MHINIFLEICDLFKQNGVSDDAIKLRLFPFSLRDKARVWLNSMLAGTFTSWNTLAEKFLARYFPPGKTAKMRNDITQFMQSDNESLYEAWEKYKDMLQRCLHHGLLEWLQVQTFYNGLNPQTRTVIDAAASGALMGKSASEAFNLLEVMASNNYQWPNEIATKKVVGLYKIDGFLH